MLTHADRELFVEALSDAERQQLSAIIKALTHHLKLSGVFILCHTKTVWTVLHEMPANCSATINIEELSVQLRNKMISDNDYHFSQTLNDPDHTLLVTTIASPNSGCDISLAVLTESPQKNTDFVFEQLNLYLQTIITIVEHILNQRRNETRLSTKQRLRFILEATRAGTWEWDITSGKTEFSERWAEIIGYELSELQPTSIDTWYKLVHPDDQKHSGELLNKCFSREADYYDCECRMKHKDGRWVWIHDRGKVIHWSADGSPLYMAGTHTDINDKKHIELALAYQANFQKLVFDNLPVYLFVKDKDFRIVTANEAFLGLYPPDKRDQVIGNTTIESYSEEEAKVFLENDIRAFESGFSETEEQIRFPNGFKRIIWTKKIRFKDIQDDTYILGVSTDITELKQNEIAMKDAMNEAEAANRAKSDFLATMTHEIRTPINGIMGMLELAGQSATDPLQQRRLSLATSSAKSLMAIINDILDFSKIEADKLTLETAPFDLDELISRVISEQLSALQHKPVEMQVDLSELPFSKVIGDELRLSQILTNLLSNAVKFTTEGSITLTVKAIPLESSEIMVEFKIADTGIGISDNQIQSLFSPFTQADSSTTRKFGGTGLGLSICQRLVKLMKGSISVHSEAGTGSEFCASVLLEMNGPASPPVKIGSVLILSTQQALPQMLTKQLSVWKTKYMVVNNVRTLPKITQRHTESFDWLLVDESICEHLQQYIQQSGFKMPNQLIKNSALLCSPSSTLTLELCDIFMPTYTLTKPFLRHELKQIVAEQSELPRQTQHTDKFKVATQDISILVVEDNAINLEVTRCLLEDAGYNIAEAENGQQALDILKRRNNISLILMDCRMPVLDGFAATQAIRAGKAGRIYNNIPIIAFTANASTQDKQDCLRAGMNAYLSKPVVKDVLLATVNSFFLPDFSI